MPRMKKQSHATKVRQMKTYRSKSKDDVEAKSNKEEDLKPSVSEETREILHETTNKATERNTSKSDSPWMTAYFQDQERRLLDHSKTVRGHLHQGSEKFGEHAGKQCTCNCTAFLLSTITGSVQNLDSNKLDNILQDGTQLYKTRSRLTSQDFLMVSELESGPLLYQGSYYKMSINCEFSGVCESVKDLLDAIDRALDKSSHIFLLLGDIGEASYTSALYRATDGGIYSYDPHARNSAGLPSLSGTSVLIRHDNKQLLHSYATQLAKSLKARYFEVLSVKFEASSVTEYRQFYYKLTKQKQRQSMCDSKREIVKEAETCLRREKRKILQEDVEQITEKRCTETESRKRRRFALSEEKHDTIKQKDKERHKEKRRNLSEEKQHKIKQKNTEDHRVKRRNLPEEKRNIIKQKNTEDHRVKRRNLPEEKRNKIKQINTEDHRVKRRNLPEEKRNKIKQKNTEDHRVKRRNLPEVKQNIIKQKNTEDHRVKRRTIPEEKRKRIKQKDTQDHRVKRRNLPEEKRNRIKQKNTEDHRVKRRNLPEEKGKRMKQKDTEYHRVKRRNLSVEERNRIKQKETEEHRIKRSNQSEKKRNIIKQKNTEERRVFRSKLCKKMVIDLRKKNTASRKINRRQLSDEPQQNIRQRDAQRKQKRLSSLSCEDRFMKAIKEYPIYICCCCERTWYKNNVQLCTSNKYPPAMNACITNTLSPNNKKYICSGCHTSLKKSKMPATASANNLHLAEIPEPLKNLTDLENILVSQRIIFLKIINLPRGRQKGTVGSFVNVPVDTESVCLSLPRTPEQSGIIALKLKRKLSYTGHHTYQNIRSAVVIRALNWMIVNNDLYKNIVITSGWEQKCQEESSDLWESLSSEETQGRDEDDESQSVESQGAEDKENTDEELEDVQAKVRGVQFDTCLHPTSQVSSMDKVYCIAPGEGKYPLDPFMDTKCEALAFPNLFPFGHGTFLGDDDDTKRIVPITAKKYFIQRITNKDSRFAASTTYLFFALNVCEKLQIQNSVNIALRKARRKDITVGELRNPDNLHDIFIKDQAFQFLQQVRGSPSYWQLAQYELLAMVRAKGIFTWFLTLSCADLQWPETIQAIAMHYGYVFSSDEIKEMSYEEKCSWLRRDPVLAARQFDYRLQAFFRNVIMSAEAPIGKVTHYFQRTEFQLRGSPHCHAVLWVEDAPNPEKSPDHGVCDWIDTYISCNLPSEDDPLYDEVVSKQVHTHSVAFRKRGNSCRFHYPKPPSDRTLLSKPDRDIEQVAAVSEQNSKLILSKVYEVLSSDSNNISELTLSEILNLATVSETAYYRALQFSKSGISVVHRRQTNSIYVNSYNKDILKIWKANMDLQFVCDPYACIAYIASYVTKDERELSQMLKSAAKEMRDADVKSRLRKVGNVYLSNREVSAQEAAYRLLSIPLKRSSSKMIWIPTDLPEDRIGILKPQTMLQELDDEDTDVFALSIIDKYQKRPTAAVINQLCLWEFASWYSSTSQTSDENDLEICTKNREDDLLPKIIKLIDDTGSMKKYRNPAIPRYHVFSINKESEKYFHQQLMLFLPWRDEEKDLKDNTSTIPCESKFENVEDIIRETKARLEHHSDLVDDALQNYGENGPPQHAWDMLDPEAEQNR